MKDKMKELYRICGAILRFCSFMMLFPFLKYCSLIIPRRIPKSRRATIFQLAPRPGFIGGDVAANALIKEAMEDDGWAVKIVSVKPRRMRNSVFKWLWGEKWGIFNFIRDYLKMDDCAVVMDGQLNIGFLQRRSVNIYHYSFRGYRRLAGKGWSIRQKLDNMVDSIIQAVGSTRCINIAVSKFQSRHLLSEGVRIHRVISNTVDTEEFKPRTQIEKHGDLLYLGGFSYYGKGIDVLEKLAEQGLNIDCFSDHFGPGPLNYRAGIPRSEVPTVINGHVILIHPSRFESCSMSVLEAMSSGLPVLISNVGIGPELRKTIPEFVVKGFGQDAINEYIYKIGLIKRDYKKFCGMARAYILENHSATTFRLSWKEAMNELCKSESLAVPKWYPRIEKGLR